MPMRGGLAREELQLEPFPARHPTSPARFQNARHAPAHPAPAEPGVAPSPYWDRAPQLAIGMLAIIAVRLHEVIPTLAALHPVAFVVLGSAVALYRKTSRTAFVAVLSSARPLLVLLLVFWALLGVPGALWPGYAMQNVQKYAYSVFLFFGIALCAPRISVLNVLQTGWVAALSVFGVVGLLSRWSTTARVRFSYTFDSNDLAAIMAMGFPLAVGLMLRGTGKVRWVGIAGAVITVLTVVATKSRGGVVGMVAGAVVLLLAMRGVRRIATAGLLALGLVVTWQFAPPIFKNRVMSLTRLENDYNVTGETGRKAIWARGLGYIGDNPILGVGIGNFPVAEGVMWEGMGTTGKWSAAHNSYLQAGAELGIPGGVAFLSLVFLSLVTGLRFARGVTVPGGVIRRPEFVASLSAYGTAAFFLSHAYLASIYGLFALLFLAHRAPEYEARLAGTSTRRGRGGMDSRRMNPPL